MSSKADVQRVLAAQPKKRKATDPAPHTPSVIFRQYPKMNRPETRLLIARLKQEVIGCDPKTHSDLDSFFLDQNIMIFELKNKRNWPKMRCSKFYTDTISEIWKYGLCGFDTEGVPPECLQICSITGKTIIFRVLKDLFDEVRTLLKESSIRKPASDVFVDVSRLDDAKAFPNTIEVNGWFDTQNLMISCFPESRSIGSEGQAKLWKMKFIPYNFVRMKWWGTSLSNECIQHAVGDVRISLVTVLEAGLAMTKWEKVPDNLNVLPWLHELIHVHFEIPRF
jgi:hypothetical protein